MGVRERLSVLLILVGVVGSYVTLAAYHETWGMSDNMVIAVGGACTVTGVILLNLFIEGRVR